jgi:hypothetical protein
MNCTPVLIYDFNCRPHILQPEIRNRQSAIIKLFFSLEDDNHYAVKV